MIIHNLCVYLLRAVRKNIIGIVKRAVIPVCYVIGGTSAEWGRVL